jgi:post-segregation antitoxin (ccd killing protein)
MNPIKKTKKPEKTIVAARVDKEVYDKLKANNINISATIEQALKKILDVKAK